VSSEASGQFVRAVRREAGAIQLSVDGVSIEACLGDSLITALLTNGRMVRRLEFDGTPRAGFCLMGACQDCWVWIGDGRRVRACTTLAAPAMSVWTSQPSSEIRP
jgi:aerobic-type carbon monoxide dehydrogenase small subunit (CoxS/CutS family)